MYSRNSNGSRTLPWGTPDSSGAGVDDDLSRCTCWLRPSRKLQFRLLRLFSIHTGQCKRTGGCYNELVVAFFSTCGGVKGKKSIPVDFIIYL